MNLAESNDIYRSGIESVSTIFSFLFVLVILYFFIISPIIKIIKNNIYIKKTKQLILTEKKLTEVVLNISSIKKQIIKNDYFLKYNTFTDSELLDLNKYLKETHIELNKFLNQIKTDHWQSFLFLYYIMIK